MPETVLQPRTNLDEFLRRYRLRRVSGSPFERPKLSLANLARLDIPGAARAMLAPETLAPVQRQTLADQWGVGDGFIGKLVRVAENPLVLLGLLLAVRYPVPLAKNLFKFAPKLEGLARNPGFIRMRVTGNFDAIYHGLRIKRGGETLPEVFKALGRDRTNFAELMLTRSANAITKFEANSGYDFTERIGIALARRLEGKPLKSLGAVQPHFETLAKDIRVGVLDDIHKRVLNAVDTEALLRTLTDLGVSRKEYARLVRARTAKVLSGAEATTLRSIEGMVGRSKREVLEQLRNAGFPTPGLPGATKLANYWPRRLAKTAEDYEAQMARLAGLTAGGESAFGRKMLAAAERVTSPHAKVRRNKMIQNPIDLKKIEDLLPDPDEVKRLAGRMAGPSPPPTYSLNFLKTIEAYTNSMASAWAWTVRGRGSFIAKAAERLEQSYLQNPVKFAHNKIRAAMLRDSYIPMAMGRATYRQSIANAQWGEMKFRLAERLNTSGLRKLIGNDTADWIQKGLLADRGMLNFRNLQGRIAGHFYVGALGGNVVSSTWNLMQTLLTTIPTIGVTATAKGFGRILSKAEKFFRLRQQGFSHMKAVERAFPEFKAAGLTPSPLTEEALGAGLSKAWERSVMGKAGRIGRGYDRVKEALMVFFQQSELLVRLTAFEGTMAKAAAEGLTKAEAVPIARRVVELTQFLAGPHATPSALKEFGPLFRQFGTFLGRYTDWLIGSSTELGSAAQRGGLFGMLPDKNLGTLGRALLTGGLAYEGAREFFGQDVSRGLMFGALPIPQADQPFSPAPYVPPVLGMAGGALQDVLTGRFEKLKYQLPIAVPGGIGIGRFTTSIAPPVARAMGREWAAYDLEDEQGRVPVFSRRGSLRGYATHWELWLDSMGFPPAGPAGFQREQELEAYLVSQRDRIRQYRKDYLEALYMKNDPQRAIEIQREFDQVYPGLGGLRVKPQDVRAVKMRYLIPRLEKTLDTLPAEMRPLFGQLVSTVLMQEAEHLLGVDPYLLATTPTASSRDTWRRRPAQHAMEILLDREEDRGSRLRIGR